MHRLLPLLCTFLLSIAFPAWADAQAVVTSDPVGFTTTSLLGSSDTYVSTPFTRLPDFVGAIQSVGTPTASTITVNPAPGWTPSQFVYAAGSQPKHYYALIGSGGSSNPKEGHTYLVTGNDATSLTVDTSTDLLTGVTANTQITLIPYWTPATLFPAPDANISFTPTTSSAAYKTQIRIPDDSAPILTYSPVYFFSSNVDGSSANIGWRVVGNNTADRGDDPLSPGSFFVIRNDNAAPTLPLTNLGGVLLKKFSVPLMTSTSQPYDNAVSILRPIDVPLDASGLGPIDGSFIANDQLLLFDNTQVAINKSPSAVYTYSIAAGNTGGWRLLGDSSAADRGNDFILAATGFVVRKAPTAGGQTAFWTNSFPVTLLSAASHKVHTGFPNGFDVPLPLTGNPGVECRSGGGTNDFQMVFTFPAAVTVTVTGNPKALITSGTGQVGTGGVADGNSITVNGATVTVPLTNVTSGQRITVTLVGVNDGTNTNDIAVRMGVLTGDTNADGSVNSADIGQTKSVSGATVGTTNFREDLNIDGSLNSADIGLVKSKSGTGFPP
ncbi:MAG: TIGR02597 family protein [Spartobacteria bacterium]